MSADEASTNDLLVGHGFICTYEPDGVEPHVPDFLAERPDLSIWIEVKSLLEERGDTKSNKFSGELLRRSEQIGGLGSAIAWLGLGVDSSNLKKLVKLAKKSLPAEGELEQRTFIAVPTKPDFSSTAEFIVADEGGPLRVISYRAEGKYGLPIGVNPVPNSQRIDIAYSDGTENSSHSLWRIVARDNFLAGFDVRPSGTTFSIRMVGTCGPGRKIRNPERLRDVLSAANQQLKCGSNSRPLPSVAFVHQAGWDVPDDREVVSAVLGDLQVQFSRNERKSSSFGLGRNGAWTGGKNTSTSALVLIRDRGLPTVFHNPMAARPLPLGLFNSPEWREVSYGEYGLVASP